MSFTLYASDSVANFNEQMHAITPNIEGKMQEQIQRGVDEISVFRHKQKRRIPVDPVLERSC